MMYSSNQKFLFFFQYKEELQIYNEIYQGKMLTTFNINI